MYTLLTLELQPKWDNTYPGAKHRQTQGDQNRMMYHVRVKLPQANFLTPSSPTLIEAYFHTLPIIYMIGGSWVLTPIVEHVTVTESK